MRSLARYAALILVAAMFVGSADAAWFHRRVYVTIAPPAPVVERVVVSPGPGYVWQHGYHRWDGRSYVWTAGTWVRTPRRYRQWIPGHWISTRRGYYWEAGHWVR